MKPSKEKEKIWIRTKRRLTEAEEKQRKFNPDDVIDFLGTKSYRNATFWRDSKQRMILVGRETGNPLVLKEELIDEIAKKWVFCLESG